MTNTIANGAPISAVTTTPPSTSTNTTVKDLGKDTFLKLLVAQLKYQDPSKPIDSSQFMAQTAQLTSVEKLTDLAASQKDLLAAQLMFRASDLIGRSVTYMDSGGKTVTGLVTSATFSGSSPTVKVGNTDVPLSSVREVTTAAG